MSTISSPPLTIPSSGYASPAHKSASPAPSTSLKPKPKPVNVFSNDGSFLERFQHLKRDEEERKKQEEILARKREFDNRFKQRGKRPPPPPESSNEPTEIPSKKPKVDDSTTQYSKEVKSYTGNGIPKEDGTGVRPLVK